MTQTRTLLYDVLSVWEVAHRWHDVDPDLTNPKGLPLPVQDTLRFLTRSIYRHDLSVCSSNGVEYKNAQTIPRFADFVVPLEEGNSVSEEERRDLYQDYFDRSLKRHYEASEELDLCFKKRIYNKEKLEQLFIAQDALERLCTEQAIPLPHFWFPDGKPVCSPVVETEKKISENELARNACQAIARTLWREYPEMNITDMIKHESINRYGNGRLYSPRTLRKWISEVDPRAKKDKTGRPKKKANA